MKRICLTLALAGLTLSSAIAQDAPQLSEKTAAQVETLIDRALADDTGYKVIESLTTEIGPRLGGSEAEARARAWAEVKLKKMGFKNVRVEEFEIPYWARIHEHASIVSPFPQELVITALGGTVGTPKGGITAKIVRFDTLEALEDAPAGSLEGKIAFVDEFMTRTQDGSGYGKAVRKRSAAAVAGAQKGAVAALIRSVGTQHHRMPHTGNMGYTDGVKQIPIAALSPPDADQLTRSLERGAVTVKLELDVIERKDLKTSGNVIAEIPGKTDEVIVIGGHLDSWDLGTGAVDDGAGVGITVGAAHIIKSLKKKPTRTIRVVLWGSEEIGLLGAREYARVYADDLDKHIVAAESDFGAGRIYQLQTRFAKEDVTKGDIMARAMSRLGISRGHNLATGGPDVTPLRALGVPVVTLKQNGWDYFDLHHTPDDTFDKINADDVAQNVAAYAAFVWMASEMPGDFREDTPSTANE